jgi:hypothetical protein
MGETKHRVQWVDGAPLFFCDGDKRADCHQYPECDDEFWPCGHPFVAHESCWKVNFVQEAPDELWFDGGELIDEIPKVDGEIEFDWDGDQLLWCYAFNPATS